MGLSGSCVLLMLHVLHISLMRIIDLYFFHLFMFLISPLVPIIALVNVLVIQIAIIHVSSREYPHLFLLLLTTTSGMSRGSLIFLVGDT